MKYRSILRARLESCSVPFHVFGATLHICASLASAQNRTQTNSSRKANTQVRDLIRTTLKGAAEGFGSININALTGALPELSFMRFMSTGTEQRLRTLFKRQRLRAQVRGERAHVRRFVATRARHSPAVAVSIRRRRSTTRPWCGTTPAAAQGRANVRWRSMGRLAISSFQAGYGGALLGPRRLSWTTCRMSTSKCLRRRVWEQRVGRSTNCGRGPRTGRK